MGLSLNVIKLRIVYRSLKNSIIALCLLASIVPFTANASSAEGKFDAGNMIFHHIGDSHEWHFATVGETHITLPLPVILYSPENGLTFFSSSKFHNAERSFGDYRLNEHDHIESISGAKFYDISITKNVASMLASAIILLTVFLSVAKMSQKNKGKAPKGLQNALEPFIVFVRDEIAKEKIGKNYERYLPYLLTVFFFIWVNNLLGLLPGGANVTGNIAITLTLALITFVITNMSGNKSYWGHIFNTPGVPWWLKFPIPLMPVVEFIGIFTKPFSLTIRLFANITAGHIIILSLISLTFIFQSVFIGVVGALFATVMNVLELLVALVQAYVFTLLSAVYIGAAVEEHDHH